MRPHGILTTVVLTAVIFLFGCSRGTSPVDTGLDESAGLVQVSCDNSHSLMGLWTFICDPDAGAVEIIPLRDAELHLNALAFLEPQPLLYITLESPPKIANGILDVDIGIRNPFVGQDIYTGFDVCGIIFTHGSETGFCDPEIVMAGEGDTRLLNADGYTRWWNPAEFPHGNTIFNYKDGMLGNPAVEADFNCTINGYKYFADDLGPDDPLTNLDPAKRGMFSAGKKNIRHFTIDLSGGLIFNYAVDACWKMPQGSPPYTPPDDFPEGANRVEAYRVEVTELGNNLYHVDGTYIRGGDLHAYVDVYDHFNPGLNVVYGESLAGLPLSMANTPIDGGPGWSRYQLSFSGKDLNQSGEAELLIAVQSEAVGYGGPLPGKPVSVYIRQNFYINPDPPPRWTIHWAQNHSADGPDVVADASGNIYVAGYHHITSDLDPGPGIDIHSGNFDISFISKFNHNGVYQWGRSWGVDNIYCEATGVDVDGSGNIYITGAFGGTVDFDPGPGVDEHTSIGNSSTYLSKFDPDGNLIWAETWGSTGGLGVTVDNDGNPSVTGFFKGTVDFDPGSGAEEYSATGQQDIYLTKFNAEGNFQWARTWGGWSFPNYESGNSVDADSLDNLYVTGVFRGNADFDPGPGTDMHDSGEGNGAFLTKFDSSGNFQWARTWDPNDAKEVAVDGFDDIYVSGHFSGTVDFDPGPGVEEHTADPDEQVFLSKFTPEGEFIRVLTWGRGGHDYNVDIAIGPSNNVYVAGNFWGTVDFDPGPGVDEHTSTVPNWLDPFLSKFDSNGNYQWGFNWGPARGSAVAVDIYENIFAVGFFGGTIDFDPGPGLDEQTSSPSEVDIYLSKFPASGLWW